MEAQAVEIPSFFNCPISLEIMSDPVTLPTGITYNRDSIEKWLFSNKKKHQSCPVTKQPLPDYPDLTPNHTLRRLIQSWCAVNSVERLPTPRPPVDKSHIEMLIADAGTEMQPSLIKKLKAIVTDSERNRRCVGSIPAALDFLAASIKNDMDALYILHSLQISEQGFLDLFSRNPSLIESLTSVLQKYNSQNSHQTRLYAMLILKSVVSVIAPARLVSASEGLFVQIVRVLQDCRVSPQARKAALQVLGGLVPWGRNRVKAVAAGAMAVLVEILIEEQDRRICEMGLVALDRLCGCAEGRAELVGHAAGVAVVSKKILRVSEVASERAVKVLYSLCKYSATPTVLKEMVAVGVVSKLCLMVQVDQCGEKAKEKAREVLRLHARVWRRAPCVSLQMQALYPSS